MQETWVWSLDEGMTTHYSIPPLENPHEQRSLASYSPWDLKELDTTEQLTYFKMKKDEWLKLRVD